MSKLKQKLTSPIPDSLIPRFPQSPIFRLPASTKKIDIPEKTAQKQLSGGRIAVLILYTLIVLQVAFLTYFSGYSSPDGLFWDENYHIG